MIGSRSIESSLSLSNICELTERFFVPSTITTFKNCGLTITNDFWSSLTDKLKKDAIEFHRMHHSNNHGDGFEYPSYSFSAFIKENIGLCIICSPNCPKGKELYSESDILICVSNDFIQIVSKIEVDSKSYTIMKSITGSISCSCRGPRSLIELISRGNIMCSHIQIAMERKEIIVDSNRVLVINPRLRKLQLDK